MVNCLTADTQLQSLPERLAGLTGGGFDFPRLKGSMHNWNDGAARSTGSKELLLSLNCRLSMHRAFDSRLIAARVNVACFHSLQGNALNIQKAEGALVSLSNARSPVADRASSHVLEWNPRVTVWKARSLSARDWYFLEWPALFLQRVERRLILARLLFVTERRRVVHRDLDNFHRGTWPQLFVQPMGSVTFEVKAIRRCPRVRREGIFRATMRFRRHARLSCLLATYFVRGCPCSPRIDALSSLKSGATALSVSTCRA